ncbi:DUF4442 domain-containing protein [Hyphobacterium sp. CCMP332]|nr:DUF4442 domain-containing protein [Hyphobacterium sp. CCMP332]
MKGKSYLQSAFQRAYKSKFHLFLLNLGISRFVPFNKPHRFKIIEISPNSVRIELPYIKRNLNHIKGIHACALATLNELASGILIISRLDPSEFRIIMKSIHLDYVYQAKAKVYVSFKLSEAEIQELKDKAKISPVDFPVKLITFDQNNNEICSSNIVWQLKSWEQVRTKS